MILSHYISDENQTLVLCKSCQMLLTTEQLSSSQVLLWHAMSLNSLDVLRLIFYYWITLFLFRLIIFSVSPWGTIESCGNSSDPVSSSQFPIHLTYRHNSCLLACLPFLWTQNICLQSSSVCPTIVNQISISKLRYVEAVRQCLKIFPYIEDRKDSHRPYLKWRLTLHLILEQVNGTLQALNSSLMTPINHCWVLLDLIIDGHYVVTGMHGLGICSK